MIKRLIFIAAVFFSTAALALGQQLPQLPNDPATRVGKLENGLTYYIRHNDKPAQRAEFYLATNVGALQETPDQDGLAHFLEHMCFNGTKNFPGKGILNYLESIGASFGGNVNASTGVEQTIYLLNNIPLINPSVVDSCLLIMHDYSHFVTLDPTEIDKERGVILEEKRSRNDASWRMREAASPYLYGDTKYATTSIIGSEENLKTFKPESLVNFYKTWYRPDMQALIVVGDINVDEVEAKIKATFADIPAAQNPKQKEVIKIPDNVEPLIGILTDPENNGISYEVYWKSEPNPEELNSTALGITTNILKSIIRRVMNERFNDISAKPDAPFIGAGFGIAKLCETSEVTYGSASCKEENAIAGFEAMLLEIEKMRRYGFSDSEVERAKTEILSSYESSAKRAETRKNSEFVMPMISHFFDNEAFMDPQMEYELVQALMQQINAQVINQVAPQLITKENMIVLYTAPEREGLVHPTEAEIKAVIEKVAAAEIQQTAGEEVPSEFLNAAALKGSKVKKSQESIYGSELITLKNGAKVYLYPSDLEKNRVSFNIFKKGGKSLISDEDISSFESNIWSLYVQNTGVAEFASTMVGKMLAGKQLSVSPYINDYTHGISGSSTTQDIETALQIAYLYYTQPRFDVDEYNQGIEQIKQVLPNLEGQPNWQLQKELAKTIYDSPRHTMLSKELLEKASLATLEKNYKSLFKDAAGLSMVIAGDFDKATVIPMIEKYIGSIKKGKKATEWSYRGDGIVDGTKVNDFRTVMQTPMVTVLQVWKANEKYSVEDEVAISALEYILGMVYTETLREEEGGTYGAQAVSLVQGEPDPIQGMQVVFQTNEESADKLRQLAIDGLKSVAENGPSADFFDKTVKNLEKNIPESKLRNSYWSSAIRQYDMEGYDYVAEYEAAVKALTPEKVKAAAAKLVASGNFIELIQRPQK